MLQIAKKAFRGLPTATAGRHRRRKTTGRRGSVILDNGKTGFNDHAACRRRLFCEW